MRRLWPMLLFLPAPVLAQPLGDPEAGLALARESCAACHAIAAGEGRAPGLLSLPFPAGEALPFEDIATARGLTEMALGVWLRTSHPTMPDLVLDDREIEDLSAYILSLRPAR